MKKIFTPLSRLRKKTMPPAAARTLSRASSTKVPTAQEGPRHFWAAGGDNAAESCLGHIKQTMRRLGFAGRGNPTKKETKSVQALAASALLRSAGLVHVLESLKKYRLALSEGRIKQPPPLAFDEPSCAWLYES